MTKPELLDFLSRTPSPDAWDVADHFDLPYPAAAMALLRLVRQGLAQRALDPKDGMYWYALTESGASRLGYFQSHAD